MKILIIGYGNPGRLDDNLGPAFAAKIEVLNLDNVVVDSNYQLTVEDAAEIALHDVVIFADASVDCVEPFEFKLIEPDLQLGFTSHIVEPQAVLALAKELFQAKTRAYVLAIRGYKFNEFGQELSIEASNNLTKAIDFIKPLLINKKL